jgi:predicted dehydrogenase
MTVGVAVVGCGLIGRRRAEVVREHPGSTLRCVSDIDEHALQQTALEFGTDAVTDWRAVVARNDVDVVVVSTSNASLAPIAVAALESGKHVLVEKPMGRNVREAMQIAAAATRGRRLVKVGFNHRYHPALAAARRAVASGGIGPVINVRAIYGHGGRPGYEREWRGDLELAGGGEATDQGVHVFDLIHWFAGLPSDVLACTQSAVWPIAPLEDNAFGLFRFASGAVASFHTSWTQWKNRFSFEVFGREGSVTVEGLGLSYGVERLITTLRRLEGGVPDVADEVFDGADSSWELEWAEYHAAITGGAPYMGGPTDGIAAMAMLDAVYRSARAGASAAVEVEPPPQS